MDAFIPGIYGRNTRDDRTSQGRRVEGAKDLPSLDEYRTMLEAHTWMVHTTSYYQLMESQREEASLWRVGYRGGMPYMKEYVRAFQHAQAAVTNQAVRTAVTQVKEQFEQRIKTGDALYDNFRERVNNLDWYYEFSDDGGVVRRARAEHEEVLAYAREKGGLYLTYYEYKAACIAKTITG